MHWLLPYEKKALGTVYFHLKKTMYIAYPFNCQVALYTLVFTTSVTYTHSHDG